MRKDGEACCGPKALVRVGVNSCDHVWNVCDAALQALNDLRFALAGRNMPFLYGGCRNGAETAWHIYGLASDGNSREILYYIPH